MTVIVLVGRLRTSAKLTDVSNLLSPQELQGLLGDRSLRLVDARFELADEHAGKAAWRTGHIPGAVHLDLKEDLSGPAGQGGRHPLPEIDEMTRTFGAAGIGPGSRVVVYDDGQMMYASRVWWMLNYLGFAEVQVLDGGFSAWQAAGLPVTQEAAPVAPREFAAKPQEQMIADRSEVERLRGREDTLLLDARSPDRFRGENETMDARAGHIPGAVNRHFQLALKDGRLRPVDELRLLYADVPKAEQVIGYCGSGVSATVNLLAIAEAGFELPRLYVGSWSDWSSADDAPVAGAREPE